MHKYERFIIYQLLIVALFYGFSGEQVTTIAQDVFDKLVVREVSVVNEEGEELINIGKGDFDMGRIKVKNNRQENSFSSIDSTGFYSYGAMVSYLTSHEFKIKQRDENVDDLKKADIITIGLLDDFSGYAEFNNSVGDTRIYIGADNEGNGIINTYNKHGED